MLLEHLTGSRVNHAARPCYRKFLAMNLQNFLAELKRRHVYRVAIAYGVVAWLLIQVPPKSFHSLKFRILSLGLWCCLGARFSSRSGHCLGF